MDVRHRKVTGGDPLAYRYGSAATPGTVDSVYVTPRKLGSFASADIELNESLNGISATFKHRPGRKNMLSLTAGQFSAFADPFRKTDSIQVGQCELTGSVGPVYMPSFLRPAIDAVANRFGVMHALPTETIGGLLYNPVALGILAQPYTTATYALEGNRQDTSASNLQRRQGTLPHWFYWLPSRVPATPPGWAPLPFRPLSPLFNHFPTINTPTVGGATGNAVWFTASEVSKSIPSLGPVEETNPLGIYSAIFLEPVVGSVTHSTANGKFGQTWVESFDDLRRVRKYNGLTDLVFSPFQHYMAKNATPNAAGYQLLKKDQLNPNSSLMGSFKLDSVNSHSGLYSLYTNTAMSLKVTPRKYTASMAYFSNLFDFNLDGLTAQKYTYEVWVKASGTAAAPTVSSAAGGPPTTLDAVSPSIDGWTLFRTTLLVDHNVELTFNFPAGQGYDDLRVAPAGSAVKSYVYHPFRNYLMAILDENNNATFFEYDNRNRLVRLKKETEKGILTITENIKNNSMN